MPSVFDATTPLEATISSTVQGVLTWTAGSNSTGPGFEIFFSLQNVEHCDGVVVIDAGREGVIGTPTPFGATVYGVDSLCEWVFDFPAETFQVCEVREEGRGGGCGRKSHGVVAVQT